MAWYWIVLIVYIAISLALGLISIFVKPLRIIAKGMVAVWKFVLSFVYVVLFWWWISLIRLIRGKKPLRFMLFRKMI